MPVAWGLVSTGFRQYGNEIQYIPYRQVRRILDFRRTLDAALRGNPRAAGSEPEAPLEVQMLFVCVPGRNLPETSGLLVLLPHW